MKSTAPFMQTTKQTARPVLGLLPTESLYHPHDASFHHSVTPPPFPEQSTTFLDAYTTNAIPTTTRRNVQQIFVGDWSNAGLQAPAPAPAPVKKKALRAPRIPRPPVHKSRGFIPKQQSLPGGIRMRSPEGLAVGAGVTISSGLDPVHSATSYPSAPTAPLYSDYTTATDIPTFPTDTMYTAASEIPPQPAAHGGHHATGPPGIPAPPAVPRQNVATQNIQAPQASAPVQQAASVQHVASVQQPSAGVPQMAAGVQPAATVQHAAQPVQQVQTQVVQQVPAAGVQQVHQVASAPVQTVAGVQTVSGVQQVQVAAQPVQTVQTVPAVAAAPAPVQTVVAAPAQHVQVMHQHPPPGSVMLAGAPGGLGHNGTVRHHSREAAAGNITNVILRDELPSAAVTEQNNISFSNLDNSLSKLNYSTLDQSQLTPLESHGIKDTVIDRIVSKIIGKLIDVRVSVGDLFDFHNFLHRNTAQNSNATDKHVINKVVISLANNMIGHNVTMLKNRQNKPIRQSLLTSGSAVDGTHQPRRPIHPKNGEKRVVHHVDSSADVAQTSAKMTANSAKPKLYSVHDTLSSNFTNEHFSVNVTAGDSNATTTGVSSAKAADGVIHASDITVAPIVHSTHVYPISQVTSTNYQTTLPVLNTTSLVPEIVSTTSVIDTITALTEINTTALDVTTIVSDTTTALPDLSTVVEFTTMYSITNSTGENNLVTSGSSTIDPDILAELLEAQEEAALLAAEHTEAAAALAAQVKAMKSPRRRRRPL